MTDPELIRAAAEKVMGWKVTVGKFADGKEWERFEKEDEFSLNSLSWNPLTSDADCWMLVDKLLLSGFSYAIVQNPSVSSYMSRVVFRRGVVSLDRTNADLDWTIIEDDRRRAITIAAVRAMGVAA